MPCARIFRLLLRHQIYNVLIYLQVLQVLANTFEKREKTGSQDFVPNQFSCEQMCKFPHVQWDGENSNGTWGRLYRRGPFEHVLVRNKENSVRACTFSPSHCYSHCVNMSERILTNVKSHLVVVYFNFSDTPNRLIPLIDCGCLNPPLTSARLSSRALWAQTSNSLFIGLWRRQRPLF